LAVERVSTATPRFSSSITNKRAFNKEISSSILMSAGVFFFNAPSTDCMTGFSEYAGAGVGHGSCPFHGIFASYAALFSGKYDDSIGPACAEKVGIVTRSCFSACWKVEGVLSPAAGAAALCEDAF